MNVLKLAAISKVTSKEQNPIKTTIMVYITNSLFLSIKFIIKLIKCSSYPFLN